MNTILANLCPADLSRTLQIVQRTLSILLTTSATGQNHQVIQVYPHIKSALKTHEAEFKIIIDQGNIQHSYFKVLHSILECKMVHFIMKKKFNPINNMYRVLICW